MFSTLYIIISYFLWVNAKSHLKRFNPKATNPFICLCVDVIITLSPFTEFWLINFCPVCLVDWLLKDSKSSHSCQYLELRALIGSSFVNELVGALTAMTAMWHDVFVWWERSAVQPAHAVTPQLLAVSGWIASCPIPSNTVCWPSRLGALFLSHSCALWTRNRCVRSNQGQALFSVLLPLGLTSCSVWSGFWAMRLDMLVKN